MSIFWGFTLFAVGVFFGIGVCFFIIMISPDAEKG
jgi:hypothetical protein